ncbi:MAG: serine/threonine protein kinase [Candidatus Riflebacteria bacterium]|nr:serine/threonine protein kinase [Candidatus Riflebacteria bacterium]
MHLGDAAPARGRDPRAGATPDAGLAPGTTFGGYRIMRLLGKGGMGVVYEAVQLSLERPVALKVLAAGLARDPHACQRFVQEGRLAARASHPNLVTVLEVAEVAGRLVLAHELVTGETVQRRLERNGALPVELALEVAATTADVLVTLHAAGILHRDLKPGNLFLSSDRGVLVGDLGIAKDQLSGGLQTRAGLLLGTPLYMAPESWDGQPATAATDLYALGVVLFECLAGRPPFVSEDPVALSRLHAAEPVPALASWRPNLPPGFDALLGRALAKDPADRFPDSAAFARAVSSLTSIHPSSSTRRRTRTVSSRERSGDATRVAAIGKTDRARPLARTWTVLDPTSSSRPLKPATLGIGLALVLLTAFLALRPAPEPPAARPPATLAPTARPAPEKPAAWLISPSFPGDETVATLERAQRALRDTREEVNRVHSNLRRDLSHLSLSEAATRTIAIWSVPLGSCRKALEALQGGVRNSDPAAVERAARLLAGLLLLYCDVQDCYSWTARSWFSHAERQGDVSAEFKMGLQVLRLKEALASTSLPVHEAVRPVLPGPDTPVWRGGVACLMTMVDGALPRDRNRPTPSELVRQSLLETTRSAGGTALFVVRGLARAERQAGDVQAAVRTLDEALAILEKTRSPAEPACLLAWFDLHWQRNWAAHELHLSPGTDEATDARRKLKAWTDMRARLVLRWPHDPRGPAPLQVSSRAQAEAVALNPDVQARLSEVNGWLRNISRELRAPMPPEPRRQGQ